ncbi:MAG: hypothetical protein HY735_07500 [Verrucomicrobia bacterium]|nr:hypothetical protein [Verrucomicrobiota bacterium]
MPRAGRVDVPIRIELSTDAGVGDWLSISDAGGNPTMRQNRLYRIGDVLAEWQEPRVWTVQRLKSPLEQS